MKKKVLIIVPHSDDELSVGGLLIPMLKKRGYKVIVLIVTNGDAECSGKTRLEESVRGLRILGVKEKNIIFLGYGNRWSGEKHLYNFTEKDRQAVSIAGKTHTYALNGHQEYHYQKYNKHCKYTRHNMKCDLTECILDIFADVIICADFDNHSDHRAITLMFEEVMGNILNNTSYRPLILKRFAYAFAWHGNESFVIKKISRSEVFDSRFELDNPYYEWNRKVLIHLSNFWVKFPLNKLHLAALVYRSQNAKTHLRSLLKQDMIFWHRRTDSLLYDAEITVSSGEKKYLTDFKRFDSNDVNCTKLVQNFWNSCAWQPLINDFEKSITIKFSEKKFISQISICASVLEESIINNCDIFVKGKVFHTGHLFPGKEKIVSIKERGIVEIKIQITSYAGVNPGISEIEIYSEENQCSLLEFQERIKQRKD